MTVRVSAGTPGGLPNDPYGDVNGDGVVNTADVSLIHTFRTNPASLSSAAKERIRRYGDIAGVANICEIGNGTVDQHDVLRHLYMAGGVIDAGTTGVVRADYGDIDGDGKVTLVDTVIVQRSVSGLKHPTYETKVQTKGLGDISPTIPNIRFGNGIIDVNDELVLTERVGGFEEIPPAYVDYWPAGCPTPAYPTRPADRYFFTDLNGITGDANHRVYFQTQSVEERRGFTVTRVVGDDNSIAGVFKGIDGSIYAVYLRHPLFYNNATLEFSCPVKMLDASAARAGTGTWQGRTLCDPGISEIQPFAFRGTVLASESVYTPAAGLYPTDTPPSTWSKTIRIRLDVALHKGIGTPFEAQQALFFDFAPYIGMIGRGQAAYFGSPARESNKANLSLDRVIVRGLTYDQTHP